MTESSTPPTAAHAPGTIVWHELRTMDMARAQVFYAAMFGWTFETSPVPGMDYAVIHLAGKRVGGMFDATGHDFPPHWGNFISVPDVDQAAARTTAAGGEVCAGPDDIPGVGRFAMIRDPQGAYVALYKTLAGDPDTSDPQPGEFCWDQLNTTDMAAAGAFYAQIVGWSHVQAGPEMGFFKYGELMEASLGIAPEGVPPHWLCFVAVADLAAAGQKAESLGATVLMGNLDAGEWGRFSIIQDPSGAVLAIHQGNGS